MTGAHTPGGDPAAAYNPDLNPHTGIDPTDPTGPSVGELFGNVTNDMSTLVRQEIALAKAEATESAKNAGKGVGLLAGAGVSANLMLVFVSLALMFLLGRMMPLDCAAFTVAVLWAAAAAVLGMMGKKNVTQVSMKRTAETTSRIPDALKGNEEIR